MIRTVQRLRDDALRIWRAGVDAVQPGRLVPEFVRVEGRELWVGDEPLELAAIRRIAVVGGGKASGAMAAALEAALGDDVLAATCVGGLVNVPEGAIVPTRRVALHAARPAGVNEPTDAAAAGVDAMLQLVAGLGPEDVCFCLISGGGSALMPAPLEGFTLAEKALLTRELSARGANIQQLNAVRRALSRVKGGGLARACGAGRLVALILSDVPGDDPAMIASGPTAPELPQPAVAIGVLEQFDLDATPAGRRAIDLLGPRTAAAPPRCRVTNLVIGNNAAAVDGAGVEAERLGYSHAMTSATAPEGPVEDVARHLAAMADRMRRSPGPDCLISGGEPTVRLAPAGVRGLGGRNQQLCLAALEALPDWRGLALVSGGTDGEDGPTDAAGAWVDETIAQAGKRLGLDAADFLARNDAYRYFEQAGGLLNTGATHTNVCDLRVLTVSRGE
jgi:hydroxypyruvate reductase